MSNYPPEKNKNKFLITERSCNYILRPVQARKENYPYTYRIANMGQEISVTVDGAWTSQNHLVLDLIGHELYQIGFQHIDEKRNTWKNNGSQKVLMNADNLIRYSKREEIIQDDLKVLIEDYKRYDDLENITSEWSGLQRKNELANDKVKLLDEYIKEKNILDEKLYYHHPELNKVRDLIYAEAIKTYRIEIKFSKIFDRYLSFFQKRRKEYFKDLIEKTSEVKFSLEYPLRIPVLKTVNNNGNAIQVIAKVDLQNVKVENDRLFSVEFDGKTIWIIYNTFFGNLYFHNMMTLNTDWFEENYLKLDGFASSIYRRFFVTRSGNKFEQIEIKALVDYFDLLNNSRYPGVIERAFEDIQNAGLISEYKINANGGKFSKGVIEVVKSSK
jgi:hypothetical protein